MTLVLVRKHDGEGWEQCDNETLENVLAFKVGNKSIFVLFDHDGKAYSTEEWSVYSCESRKFFAP